jgi:hypothetical protein
MKQKKEITPWGTTRIATKTDPFDPGKSEASVLNLPFFLPA